MKTFQISILVVLSALFLSSCLKYEEGGIAMNAETKLTKSSWEHVSTSLEDSLDLSKTKVVYTFKATGIVTMETTSPDTTFSIDTSWALLEDKTKIRIGRFNRVIEKFTKDELWYSYEIPVPSGDPLVPPSYIYVLDKFKTVE